MQIALPDLNTPATLILDREHGLTDEAYFAFCAANPDLNVERTRDGEIVIVPPAGGESDYRTVKAIVSLDVWAVEKGQAREVLRGNRAVHAAGRIGAVSGRGLGIE